MMRMFTPDGKLVPIAHEAALEATARAEQEAARAEQEAARAERAEDKKARMAEKLRELGVDPDKL